MFSCHPWKQHLVPTPAPDPFFSVAAEAVQLDEPFLVHPCHLPDQRGGEARRGLELSDVVVVGRGETWPSVGLCVTPNICF